MKHETARRTQHPKAPGTGPVVRDIMSSEVLVLDAELTLRDAVELLSTHRITGAPVVAGDRVVGTLSANDVLAFEADIPGVPTERTQPVEEDDVEEAEPVEWEPDAEDAPPSAYFGELWSDAGADVTERFKELAGPEWDVLAEHTVGEAMSRGVRAVSPETTVRDAAAYMLKQRIHRAVVMDHSKLVGIVTTTDVMRTVAESSG
ncbi:MAG TPA: CBS domain-containing protein [Gemmatimonadales bacterium]|nr:CBS domain-containing protein [Gemmatimonadales bacterium]